MDMTTTMKNDVNHVYIVTDTADYKSGHITMTSPEQFIHRIETVIIYYCDSDEQKITAAANRLIDVLNRQIAGEDMHKHINPAANELDLRVTVIAGTVLADWNE